MIRVWHDPGFINLMVLGVLAIAGWLAGQVVKGAGFGLIVDIIVGIAFLFADALGRADGPFLLTAALPVAPAVLALLHPVGLGDGERAVS